MPSNGHHLPWFCMRSQQSTLGVKIPWRKTHIGPLAVKSSKLGSRNLPSLIHLISDKLRSMDNPISKGSHSQTKRLSSLFIRYSILGRTLSFPNGKTSSERNRRVYWIGIHKNPVKDRPKKANENNVLPKKITGEAESPGNTQQYLPLPVATLPPHEFGTV